MPTRRNYYTRIKRELFARFLDESSVVLSLQTQFIRGLRHFFATHCVEAGVKPKALAKIMGHEDFRTTMKFYVDASDLMLEEAYDKM